MIEYKIENKKKQPKLSANRCWFWPLAGVLFTFIAGFPLNYLINGFRGTWELLSTILNTVFIFLGLYFISRNLIFYKSYRRLSLLVHTAAGVLLNSGLALLLFINGLANYYFNADSQEHLLSSTQGALQKPYQGQSPDKLDIWIDLAATGRQGALEDMDNYYTLIAALRSPELNIQGISTVFGSDKADPAELQNSPFIHDIITILGDITEVTTLNSPVATEKMQDPPEEPVLPDTATRRLRALPPIYNGSTEAGTPYWPVTAASSALANHLTHQRLSIIALGPLTNIATLLKHYPALASQIDRIILLAGRKPGDMLYAGKQWWYRFRHFNVTLDTVAANIVLYSGVPLVLLPFDLGTKMLITDDDLKALQKGDPAAQWLGRKSLPWLGYWQNVLHKEGFHAFNLLTVGYAVLPELFSYRPMSARIGFNLFLEPFGMGRNIEITSNPNDPRVIYCYDMDITLKQRLLNRLKGLTPLADSVQAKK